MSERDPDPMDKAYVQAEALLDDAAARAARRARVLAAVAAESVAPVAPVQAEPSPEPVRLRRPWGRGGWLIAASVAGLSVLVAVRLNPPGTAPNAPLPPPQVAAASAPDLAAPPSAVAPAAKSAAAAPSTTSEADVAPPQGLAPVPAAPLRALKPVQDMANAPPPPPAPALAPVPLPITPPTTSAARVAPQLAPAQVQGFAANRAKRAEPADKSSVQELVVTGEKRQSAEQARAAQLRGAAAAGDLDKMAYLLNRDVAVDDADDAGETALMAAIQADQPEAARFLLRRGARLDRKNQEGRSAREMAAAADDPKLKAAVGLKP